MALLRFPGESGPGASAARPCGRPSRPAGAAHPRRNHHRRRWLGGTRTGGQHSGKTDCLGAKGGARAGSGCGTSVARPRCERRRRTAGCSIVATRRRRPPHVGGRLRRDAGAVGSVAAAPHDAQGHAHSRQHHRRAHRQDTEEAHPAPEVKDAPESTDPPPLR